MGRKFVTCAVSGKSAHFQSHTGKNVFTKCAENKTQSHNSYKHTETHIFTLLGPTHGEDHPRRPSLFENNEIPVQLGAAQQAEAAPRRRRAAVESDVPPGYSDVNGH